MPVCSGCKPAVGVRDVLTFHPFREATPQIALGNRPNCPKPPPQPAGCDQGTRHRRNGLSPTRVRKNAARRPTGEAEALREFVGVGMRGIRGTASVPFGLGTERVK